MTHNSFEPTTDALFLESFPAVTSPDQHTHPTLRAHKEKSVDVELLPWVLGWVANLISGRFEPGSGRFVSIYGRSWDDLVAVLLLLGEKRKVSSTDPRTGRRPQRVSRSGRYREGTRLVCCIIALPSPFAISTGVAKCLRCIYSYQVSIFSSGFSVFVMRCYEDTCR